MKHKKITKEKVENFQIAKKEAIKHLARALSAAATVDYFNDDMTCIDAIEDTIKAVQAVQCAGHLQVAKWSRFPCGRYVEHGSATGAGYRAIIHEALENCEVVTVDFNGIMGAGASWLEECFGGLVRMCGYSVAELEKRLTLVDSEPTSVQTDAWQFIREAGGRT